MLEQRSAEQSFFFLWMFYFNSFLYISQYIFLLKLFSFLEIKRIFFFYETIWFFELAWFRITTRNFWRVVNLLPFRESTKSVMPPPPFRLHTSCFVRQEKILLTITSRFALVLLNFPVENAAVRLLENILYNDPQFLEGRQPQITSASLCVIQSIKPFFSTALIPFTFQDIMFMFSPKYCFLRNGSLKLSRISAYFHQIVA